MRKVKLVKINIFSVMLTGVNAGKGEGTYGKCYRIKKCRYVL